MAGYTMFLDTDPPPIPAALEVLYCICIGAVRLGVLLLTASARYSCLIGQP